MRCLPLLLLGITIVGCQTRKSGNTGQQPFNLDSVKAHILKMNESYSQRFATNDSIFYVERYCKDARVYSPGMPAVTGRDSIRSFFYNGGNNTEAKIELPTGIFYGNADWVVEDGTYSFPDGKGGFADKGKFIAIWKQENGKWKLYREIWNTDLAPQQ
jgi:ketosteroid isomerase-like protein